MLNLLSNAFYSVIEKSKLTKGFKPEINVTTKFTDATCEIVMRDNGKGIPQTEVKNLFSPFYTTKLTSKGSGLGLYVTQDMIKTHKGNISVTSIEGYYTDFTITIPLSI